MALSRICSPAHIEHIIMDRNCVLRTRQICAALARSTFNACETFETPASGYPPLLRIPLRLANVSFLHAVTRC